MQKHLIIFFIALFLLPTGGCASFKQNRWLSAHRQNITRLATGAMSAEEKLDGLLSDYVQFMKEDLKFVNPVKGVKYVKKYHDQNLGNMEKILKKRLLEFPLDHDRNCSLGYCSESTLVIPGHAFDYWPTDADGRARKIDC